MDMMLIMLLVMGVLLILLFLRMVPIGLWLTTRAASVDIDLMDLIGMRMRRIKLSEVVLPYIEAKKAGLNVSIVHLEIHYMAGGRVDKVVDDLIAAKEANSPLGFERAAANDFVELIEQGRIEPLE